MMIRILGVQVLAVLLGFWLSHRVFVLYGERYFLASLAGVLAIFLLASWIFGKRSFVALARLRRKAVVMRGRSARLEKTPDDDSELLELELTLDQMQRNLALQNERLAREREELKALLGAMSDAVIAISLEGESLYLNEKFSSIFASQFKAAAGQKSRLTDWLRNPDILHAFQSALSVGLSQTVSLESYVANEVQPRYFVLSIAPLRKKNTNEVYGAIGIFHDVTTLKRAEKIRIDFVANVSHELRTPLTAIRGYTDTLLQDIRDQRMDSIQEFGAAINRNVDRLMSLIHDLLDLSSLESNTVLKKNRVSTRDVSEHVIRTLKHLIESKKHQVQLQIEEGAEFVFADLLRLEQVLVNLLSNSIKYVPSSGQIQVRWFKSSEPSDGKMKIVLEVRDNGPGIPIEHQARLFERFYRVDQARSREMGGTGLGLAIVKHIMLAHGGAVRLVSPPGEGSVFLCEFVNEVG